jgi:hypothetical protein
MIWPPHYDRYSVYQIQENEMGGLCEREEECTQPFGGET